MPCKALSLLSSCENIPAPSPLTYAQASTPNPAHGSKTEYAVLLFAPGQGSNHVAKVRPLFSSRPGIASSFPRFYLLVSTHPGLAAHSTL